MILLFYIIFSIVFVIGTIVFFVFKAVQNFRMGRKNQGKKFIIFTVLFMYGVFHKVTFGQMIGEKWSVGIQNNSSIENPEIILDFKKLYVHNRINLRDCGYLVYDNYNDDNYASTAFYTKNSGYELHKVIVPKGIKAKVDYDFDCGLDIILTDE